MQHNLMQLSGVDLVVPTHGLEGAKAYPLGINCRVPLFDDEDDVFYIKSTDANGFPTVKKYRFTEEIIVDTNNSGNGVALQDIRNLIREELGVIKEELTNAKQPISAADSTEIKSDDTAHTSVVKHNAIGEHGHKQQRSGVTAVEAGEVQQQSSANV